MSTIYPLKGAIQHYAWGGTSFISNLLNVENTDNQPFAELWLGAHQRGPARLVIDGKEIPLNEWIENNETALGEKVLKNFGKRLPFLFKVLDVNKMLSIQSHPTKTAAEIGFARENDLEIPLTARYRNYKDDNHKPEVMVALTDFYLLHGFRSVEAIDRVLEEIPEFTTLRKYFACPFRRRVEKNEAAIFSLYKTIMEMPQEAVDEILKPLGKRLEKALLENKLSKSHSDYWAALAFRDNALESGHVDRGIFSIYFFNLVHLKKGEGIFQDAGIPHAYLEGINIELMANSDNVFRGGLTVKHVDVNELLEHLVFEPVTPKILDGKNIAEGVRVFETPAPDFELVEINLIETQQYISGIINAPEILIVMEGIVVVRADNIVFDLKKGQSFFASAGADFLITCKENAIIFKAGIPQ